MRRKTRRGPANDDDADAEGVRIEFIVRFDPFTKQLELKSEPGDTPETLAAGAAAFNGALAHMTGETLPASASAIRNRVITLGALVEEFLPTCRSSKTLRAYRTALHQEFLPHFGKDTDIQDVDQDAFAAWVRKVFDPNDTRAHSTKNGYINAVTSMFSWRAATHSKTTPKLSTQKLIPVKEVASSDERDAFEVEEIGKIFGHVAQYRQTEPHKFWVTVCVAFMGCRIEELAQVDLKHDLRQDPRSRCWYFSINADPDQDGVKRKALKKPTSKRFIPIHTALIRHGLLDYLTAQAGNPTGRPFEGGWKPWIEPQKGETLYSHYITRWGGGELRTLRKAGILTRPANLVFFHSMRATQTNHYSKRGVSAEHRSSLHGQQVPHGGENGQRYLALRQDLAFLAAIVEEHLGVYSDMLDAALTPLRT